MGDGSQCVFGINPSPLHRPFPSISVPLLPPPPHFPGCTKENLQVNIITISINIKRTGREGRRPSVGRTWVAGQDRGMLSWTGDVSSHWYLLNYNANTPNIFFTRPSCGKCQRASPEAGLPTQALLCGIRRESTKFSSLRCQKRQALICKARRPYQEPSYLQRSRAVSKGSLRCLYFFHFPSCHILYLLFISVKPQSKTDGLLPESWMC